MTPSSIAVLGAGSWGTALAIHLAANGHVVRLWGHEPEHVSALAETRENAAFLPGVVFPENLQPEADFDAALANSDDLLLVVPSHAFGEVVERVAASPNRPRRICWATKGFEAGTGRFLHDVAGQLVPASMSVDCPLAVISGPTFATEVARGLPTAVTVAANDEAFAQDIAAWFSNDHFRCYTSDDLIGVQLGGAAKNVMAIAAGISDGMGFGANSRSALITRGLIEIMRLGVALGARMETLQGLAGMGDLVLTCTDDQSRNRRFGLALGRGVDAQQAIRDIGQVVEGVHAARELRDLARAHGVEMPICEVTARVLFDGFDPRAAVSALFARATKPEGF